LGPGLTMTFTGPHLLERVECRACGSRKDDDIEQGGTLGPHGFDEISARGDVAATQEALRERVGTRAPSMRPHRASLADRRSEPPRDPFVSNGTSCRSASVVVISLPSFDWNLGVVHTRGGSVGGRSASVTVALTRPVPASVVERWKPRITSGRLVDHAPCPERRTTPGVHYVARDASGAQMNVRARA